MYMITGTNVFQVKRNTTSGQALSHHLVIDYIPTCTGDTYIHPTCLMFSDTNKSTTVAVAQRKCFIQCQPLCYLCIKDDKK